MFSSAVTLLLVVNSVYLSFAAKEPPTVTIPNQGILVGKEMSTIRTQRILAYLGIPYAKPPVRFAPPETTDLPAWEGARNATEFEAGCMQVKESYKDDELPFLHLLSKDLSFAVSEDCLYLNVFVPYGECVSVL